MAKPAAKAVPVVIEGLEITSPNVTFPRLQEFALTLYERLLILRADRNRLLQDRDNLVTVLTNLRQEIRETESSTVNLEAELQQAQERFRQDIKEVEQEVKYLEYDHKINLDQLKAWENGLIAKAEEEDLKEMLELLEEKRKLKETIQENEMKMEEQLLNMKKNNAEELDELRKKNEEAYIKKEMEFKRGLVEMKNEMRLRHEMEMSQVEESNNCHLMELRNIHKKRLGELKRFFNNVTAEDLAVISCMRESLEGISKMKVGMTEEIETLKKENKRLQKPLEQTKTEVKNLSRQLANYQKDLLSLKNNNRQLKNTDRELEEVKTESKVALETILGDSNSFEDESLDMPCVKTLVHFRNYAASRRRQLENAADSMLKELEKKKRILRRLSTDRDTAKVVAQLKYEFWNPRQLIYELNVAKAAYNEALLALEEKLKQFCVPESLTQTTWKVMPGYSGAAGLVSKQ